MKLDYIVIIVLYLLLPSGILAQHYEHDHKNPRSYVCQYISHAMTIDGLLSSEEWDKASWTDAFVDIEGYAKPKPYYQTRVKMLWDDQYFYIAAELEEEHLWATYDKRDMVIFHENDFEVFIDPNGDTHNYYELEINALGTIWDLLLTKPYRDNGQAIDAWDITGLKSAVKLYGTLNQPNDKDEKWTIELAFPWGVLEETAAHKGAPKEGERWRVNFSRVHWQIEAKDGQYVKKINPKTGKAFPEYNWVWSPQYKIAMHMPEFWGKVYFTKDPAFKEPYNNYIDSFIQWKLRVVYYGLSAYYAAHNSYPPENPYAKDDQIKLDLITTKHTFLASIDHKGRRYYIREDGKLWSSTID